MQEMVDLKGQVADDAKSISTRIRGPYSEEEVGELRVVQGCGHHLTRVL